MHLAFYKTQYKVSRVASEKIHTYYTHYPTRLHSSKFNSVECLNMKNHLIILIGILVFSISITQFQILKE